MLKNFYSKLSLVNLTFVNKNILDKISKKIREAGFKIISPESYNSILIVFTGDSDLHEVEDLIVLNLNFYTISSKSFALDNWSMKILAYLSKILSKIESENSDSLAFIICTNPFTLTDYLMKDNIKLNKDARILQLAPTNLYFSIFQKTINYFILDYNKEINTTPTFERILEEIVNTNILLNAANNYLTEHVIKKKFYDAFTVGGSLLKAYNIGEDGSQTLILISLETPPPINAQIIVDNLRASLHKIGVSLKNFLEFKSAHIQPFNALYRIMEEAYMEVVGEQPYIDWFTMPSTVEVFNKIEIENQLIFGPGVVTKPIDDRVFEEQCSLFLKVFKAYLKIRRGV